MSVIISHRDDSCPPDGKDPTSEGVAHLTHPFQGNQECNIFQLSECSASIEKLLADFPGHRLPPGHRDPLPGTPSPNSFPECNSLPEYLESTSVPEQTETSSLNDYLDVDSLHDYMGIGSSEPCSEDETCTSNPSCNKPVPNAKRVEVSSQLTTYLFGKYCGEELGKETSV